jgi:anti-sigma-K factor RskA
LARGASGEIVWSADRRTGFLRVEGLAAVEPERGVYQLWIFDRRRDERYPVDGGLFGVDDAGKPTIISIRPALDVAEPTLFAITLEPPGGVVVSDRKRILLAGNLDP